MSYDAYVYAVMPDGFDDHTLAENEFVGKDQATIQTAIDYLHAKKHGGTVHLSRGEFALSNIAIGECLRLYSGINLEGGNIKGSDPTKDPIMGTCIVYDNMSMTDEVVPFSALLQIFGVEDTDGVYNTSNDEEWGTFNLGSSITNIMFDGNEKVDHGIYGTYLYSLKMDGVSVFDAGVGIQITESTGVNITDSNVYANKASSFISLHRCNDVRLTNLVFESLVLSEDDNVSLDITSSNNVYIEALSCSFFNTTSATVKVKLTDTDNIVIKDIYYIENMGIELTESDNIHISGISNDVKATGCKGIVIAECSFLGNIDISGSTGCIIQNISVLHAEDNDTPAITLNETPNAYINNISIRANNGINLVKSDGSVIGGVISISKYNGIHVDSCNGVIISGAYASGAEYDILIETSTYCLVYGSRYENIQYSGEGNKADQGLNNQIITIP